MTKESEYWQNQLDALRRTQLDTLRATAAKWQATIASLLGVFGSVAFVGGVTKLDELPPSDATQAKALVATAVVLALVATLAAAYASAGLPRRTANPTWEWLAEASASRASKALAALRVSQVLALAATVCVVGGSLKLLLDSSPKVSTPAMQVVVVDGAAHCGTIESGDHGLVLRTASDRTVALDHGVTTMLPVDACPS